MACTLEFREISKSYAKGVPVLRDLDLKINAGEIFFLLGPSGCGKSTLLRIAAGLIRPDAGCLLLDGQDITALPPEKRNMPMVFQSYALWPHMDVFENVAFALRARKIAPAEIRKRTEEILEVVRMTPFLHRKTAALSGGQQQRVALARALVLEPSVLLLDEPLSNLDAKLRDVMRLEIRRICRERGLTALYVTHDRHEALGMADRLAVLKDGVVLQCGAPRSVYRFPDDSFTASFLGDANFLDAEFLAKDGKYLRFRTGMGELLASSASGAVPEPGETRRLMFRPEAVRFDAPADGVNTCSAEVRESWFLGDVTQMNLQSGPVCFMASESAGPDRPDGSVHLVRIDPEHLVCLASRENGLPCGND